MKEYKSTYEEMNVSEILRIVSYHKVLILILGLSTALIVFIYTLTIHQNYKGSVVLEIGTIVLNNNQTNNKSTVIQQLDTPKNLEIILLRLVPQKIHHDFFVTIYDRESNFIEITVKGANKKEIVQKLKKIVDLIIARHHKKIKLYLSDNTKVQMTQMVGEIILEDDPLKPKKHILIIIALFTGFVVGIFIAFLIEFKKALNYNHRVLKA